MADIEFLDLCDPRDWPNISVSQPMTGGDDQALSGSEFGCVFQSA